MKLEKVLVPLDGSNGSLPCPDDRPQSQKEETRGDA